MDYSIVYVGMDVHKETFSLYCYTNEKEFVEYPQNVEAHYGNIINYIEAMRFHYGDDVLFICEEILRLWIKPTNDSGASTTEWF